MPSPILTLIEGAKSIVLATHQNPDLDGLASMLAFALTFQDKTPLPLVEDLPFNSHFLHGIERVQKASSQKEALQPDLLIVFDAQCEKRIPEEVRKLLKPAEVLIFDHHQREDCSPFLGCNPVSLINPEAPSTTYVLYKFLREAKLPITREVSENLLAGLYYDTGGFRYENVKGDIFLVAQELLNLGARAHVIAQAIFENLPLEQLELTRLVLERLLLLKGGSIALSYLTREDFARLSGETYLNDPASYLRSIKGVQIAALVKETEEGLIKVSLRSKAPVEVIELAKKFGGGGHKYACGFRVRGVGLQDFLSSFKKELEAFL